MLQFMLQCNIINFTRLWAPVNHKMKKNVSQPLIIKKYENRRLYNSLTSQYINQDQVAQLVREGHDVRVVDAATGEDLTRLILAQIVVEDAKTPDSIFPARRVAPDDPGVGRGNAGECAALHENHDGDVPKCLPRIAADDEPVRVPAGALGTIQPGGRRETRRRSRTGSGRPPSPGRSPARLTNSSAESRNWNCC